MGAKLTLYDDQLSERLAVVASGGDRGQGAGQRTDAFFRHQRRHRVGVARIECLDCMRDRIDA